MKRLSKYSFGLGDRFGKQGKAQLKALINAEKELGLSFDAVWNKSFREHKITGTDPESVRREADETVTSLKWKGNHFVDADHINMETVDAFIESSDFFTIDVASYIGKPAFEEDEKRFLDLTVSFTGELKIPGIGESFEVDEQLLKRIVGKFLFASRMAGKIYRKIEATKGKGNFITEVSMDEVETPQTPVELFFILMMLSEEGVPVQTIAPKFSGRFNKGVDYVGDLVLFRDEFEKDLLVLKNAVMTFGLPGELKLSIHSGSDKFSIYPVMGELVEKHKTGIHIKTAGTTWLEELIGLAKAGGEALEFVKEVYFEALDRLEELTAPYADVIDIDHQELPEKDEVLKWNSEKMVNTLQHEPENPEYNKNLRQLMHVGYKIAAERSDVFGKLQDKYEDVISECVTKNIYERHIKRLFPGKRIG
jgi:hypothetical protein